MADDYTREMADALRLEPFTQGGSNRLVKVLAISDGVPVSVGGYVVQEKFLVGCTPPEIEKRLGLPLNSLALGCRILGLRRQPGPSEVSYELTTKYPDGLAHTILSDQRYPPGNKAFVHQWRLTGRIAAMLLCQLSAADRYQSRPW